METCPDCGSRVYKLGCVNCNEAADWDGTEFFEVGCEAENATV